MTNWTIESYVDPYGRFPVEEFLDQLPADDRARIDHTIGLLREFGVIYFAFTGQRFILLHGFLQKTQKTPRKEIVIAQRRLADFLEYEGAAR